MSESHPLAGARDAWEAVVDDMAATAAEYRDAGFETLALHPGDVTVLPTPAAAAGDIEIDRLGLDVLLPGDEFESLQGAVADHEFEAYDAYRAGEGGLVFLVIAMKSVDDSLAVLFPVYYEVSTAQLMLARVADRGEMRTYLRPLDDSERVVFSQSDPENLLPEGFDPKSVDEETIVSNADDLEVSPETAVDDVEDGL
ncbi:hypothetical protein [Halobaculum sp. MBLA0143]|uniref:DUF7529 family protein n=1 Tax=Halobaculum sp. MBLA0143 TaxID=3079933 RepID=UPI00352440AA